MIWDQAWHGIQRAITRPNPESAMDWLCANFGELVCDFVKAQGGIAALAVYPLFDDEGRLTIDVLRERYEDFVAARNRPMPPGN